MTNDADETDSLDFNMLVLRLKEVVKEDGLTRQEAHLVESFELVVGRYSRRVRLRLALETLIKSGVNRYATTKARDAGMAVLSLKGEVYDLVPYDPESDDDPRHPYAAAIAA